ncbi:hypothetical protein D9M70_337550 [compost metagenome]
MQGYVDLAFANAPGGQGEPGDICDDPVHHGEPKQQGDEHCRDDDHGGQLGTFCEADQKVAARHGDQNGPLQTGVVVHPAEGGVDLFATIGAEGKSLLS